MKREVLFAPEAQQDLMQLYDYIGADSGPARASAYAEQIAAYCLALVTFPERGTVP